MNTPEARTPDGTIIDQSKPPEAAPVEAKTETAPEAYTDFTIPEGSELDKATVSEVTPIFKELGLSQEGAQKLVDFYSNKIAANAKANQSAIESMREQWRSELKSDPDIGSKLDVVAAEIGKLKVRLPEATRAAFDNFVNETGIGDNPILAKVLYEFSKLVNEGSHVSGSGPSPNGQTRSGETKRPSLAAAMYPNLSQ